MTITWSQETLPAIGNWQRVAWSGTAYCAIAYGSDAVATSPNGRTWTAQTNVVSANWWDIAWGAGVFCAIANDSGTIAATSPDGVTWTARTLPTTATWSAIAFGNGVFCAIASGGTAAATSPDGITWTARTLPASAEWQAIAWSGTVFCAIANNSSIAATSPDGITWTQHALPSSTFWRDIAWNGSIFVVVSSNTAAASSPDGITWTARTLPSSAGWETVVWEGTQFVALCDYNDDVATSADGITWVADTVTPLTTGWYGAVSAESGVLFVVGYATSTVLLSGLPSDLLSSGLGVALTSTVKTSLGVTDSLATTDTTSNNLAVTLADAITASGTWEPEVLANLIDRLVAASSPSYTSVLQGTASDSVAFMDTVMAAWALLLAEEIATAGDAVGTVHKLAALIDAMVATGQASNTLSAFAACTAAMAMEGLIAQGFNADIADAALLADTSAAIARMLGPLVDALAVSDEGVPMLRVSCISADALALDGDLSAILSANADLADGLLFYVSLRLGDTDYVGWCLNTASLAPSEYRNYPFDSFATHRGSHFAAGPNGIARIGGSTDDGANIDAWLRTFLTTFGTNKFKRCPDAYIGVTAGGDLVLKVITLDPATGVKYQDWYTVTRKQELGPGQGRVQVGRGLKSTWWQFEIHNKAGSDFDLDSIQLRPLVLDRRT